MTMKLYGSLFLILLVLGEFKCAPVWYSSRYPMGRRRPFITDCGFGVRRYPYQDFETYYEEAYYVDPESDNAVDILRVSTEKTSDEPLDKLSEKPLEKPLEKLSENHSEKLAGKPSVNPLTPLIEIPNESITEFVLPDEPLN